MTAASTLPIWAQRLVELRSSRGWLAADTAKELKQLSGTLPSIKHLSHMIRTDWESGSHRPSPRYRALLAAVYGVDESEIFDQDAPTLPGEDEDEVERRQLLQALAALGVSASPAAGALQSIHESVDRAVGRGESHHLDDWEEALDEHGYAYVSRPPRLLIGELAADLVAVRQIMARTRSEDRHYPAWCRITGGLTGLMAMTLANLGQSREARTWWNTAQHAADASGDPDLRMWVHGERLIYGIYQGRPTPVLLRLANAAAHSAPDAPCRGLAHIRTVRAQVLALAGQRAAAAHELRRSHDVFAELPRAVTGNVGSILTGWGEHRLHYTEAWVHAQLGEREQLDQAVARVHDLLPPAHHRMRTQINLVQALGHIRAGDVTGGIQHAHATYAAYPAEQRTVLVAALADQVWDVVPTEKRRDPGVAGYRELLVAAPQRKAIT